ncbi:hypothetical protein ACLIYP_29535, partial [Streptomyces nanhaiensis]
PLPGTVAEANGNALPPRPDRARPATAAAGAAGTDAEAEAAGTDVPETGAAGEGTDPADPADVTETAQIPRITEETPPPSGEGHSRRPAASGATGVAEADEAAADPARDALVRAAGPYYVEPEDPSEHSRARDEAPAPASVPTPAPAPGDGASPAPRTVTAKGLPKRTPQTVETAADIPRPRTGGLKAEELRRRLGGFQQGARDGQRDAEAQIAAEQVVPGRDDGPADDRAEATDTGGTVEEARK